MGQGPLWGLGRSTPPDLSGSSQGVPGGEGMQDKLKVQPQTGDFLLLVWKMKSRFTQLISHPYFYTCFSLGSYPASHTNHHLFTHFGSSWSLPPPTFWLIKFLCSDRSWAASPAFFSQWMGPTNNPFCSLSCQSLNAQISGTQQPDDGDNNCIKLFCVPACISVRQPGTPTLKGCLRHKSECEQSSQPCKWPQNGPSQML